MPTTLDQREKLLAEFSDAECDALFAPGNVPQERLDELMQIVRCDIDAARLALRKELARIAAECSVLPAPCSPFPNPIPLP